MTRRERYQALNVEQALIALRHGYKITAADGCRMFPSDVQKVLGLTPEIHSRAFDSLIRRGFIQFDAANSQVTGPNRYGIWVATDKAKVKGQDGGKYK